MKGRFILTLAAGTGLWLGGSVEAAETKKDKTVAVSSNQAVADEVARRIKASGTADGASIQIKAEKGKVELTGTARSMDQQQDIAKAAMGVDGVNEVYLNMTVPTMLESSQPMLAQPVSTPAAVPMPSQYVVQARMQSLEPGSLALNPPAAMPTQQPMMMGGGFPTNDPIPLVGPGQASFDPSGPKMPGYSWPTYAPYNNVSRVAYPQAYPYNAFPYIGPYYPFPKVPLGWRTVQLSWEDGHWYMGRVSTPHDYWRVRFW